MKPYFMVLCILLCGCTKPFVISSGDYYMYDSFGEPVISRSKQFAAIYLNQGTANIERRTINFEYLEEQKQQDSTPYLKTITKKADSAYNYIFECVPQLERTGYMKFKITFYDTITNTLRGQALYEFDLKYYKSP